MRFRVVHCSFVFVLWADTTNAVDASLVRAVLSKRGAVRSVDTSEAEHSEAAQTEDSRCVVHYKDKKRGIFQQTSEP